MQNIWVDGVAPRGAKVAMGHEELDIVTTEDICKESPSRIQSSKANSVGKMSPFQK